MRAEAAISRLSVPSPRGESIESNRIESNRIESARLVRPSTVLFSRCIAGSARGVASHWIILALAAASLAHAEFDALNCQEVRLLLCRLILFPCLTVASLHSIIFIHRNSKHFDTFRIDFHCSSTPLTLRAASLSLQACNCN